MFLFCFYLFCVYPLYLTKTLTQIRYDKTTKWQIFNSLHLFLLAGVLFFLAIVGASLHLGTTTTTNCRLVELCEINVEHKENECLLGLQTWLHSATSG